MSDATERPWEAVNVEGDGDIWLVDQTGTVAHLFSDVIGDYYEAKANVDLIVQAVNEREELLEQNREMLKLLKGLESVKYGYRLGYNGEEADMRCPICGEYAYFNRSADFTDMWEQKHTANCPFHKNTKLGKTLTEGER